MKHTTENASEPLCTPGVELVLSRLTADLQRLLGEGTEFCLVVAQDSADIVNIQAITNATAHRAHQLLRAADGMGFDSVH